MMPIVGQLLGAGLNLLANAALAKGKDWLKEKTGVDVDKGELSEADKVALRKFELEHEEELLKLRLEENKLDVELSRMYLSDLASARDREAAIAVSEHAPWYVKMVPPVLALGTVALTFVLFFVIIGVLDEDGMERQREILIYILGVLSAICTQIISYYFGSSSGSKEKSRQLEQMLTRKGEPS